MNTISNYWKSSLQYLWFPHIFWTNLVYMYFHVSGYKSDLLALLLQFELMTYRAESTNAVVFRNLRERIKQASSHYTFYIVTCLMIAIVDFKMQTRVLQ